MIKRVFAVFLLARPACCTHPASAREPLLWANTGGPSSRVVSTPVVSKLLSTGSATLGLSPLGRYEMHPRTSGSFRQAALNLLRKTGFGSPEQAWEALRDKLPSRPALATEVPPERVAPDEQEAEHRSLIAALVLGKCCGGLFSPARPIIWSERRLARCLKLVHSDPHEFTRQDDE